MPQHESLKRIFGIEVRLKPFDLFLKDVCLSFFIIYEGLDLNQSIW